MELHRCRKEPCYDGNLSPCQVKISIGQSVFELESGNGNVDGQTDNKRTDGITQISKGT